MKKILLLLITVVLSSFAVFAQEKEFVANFPCEEFEVGCKSTLRQELTLVTSSSQFHQLFQRVKKDGDCDLPLVSFNDYFLVCLKPSTLFGCNEPNVNVYLNWEQGKNLSIKLNIEEFGNCYQLWPCEIWLRIPLEYYTATVDFKISREKRSHID